jgi:CheY-like chemotaxis protein
MEDPMSKKIMVVDDDQNIVDYLVTLFEDNGYETCSASDGVEALVVMKDELPDLVTLDLEMPDEWGPRFYRKFNQDPELADTPVIVISGLSGIHLAIRKAVATVSKPFDPDQVIQIVQETIGG